METADYFAKVLSQIDAVVLPKVNQADYSVERYRIPIDLHAKRRAGEGVTLELCDLDNFFSAPRLARIRAYLTDAVEEQLCEDQRG